LPPFVTTIDAEIGVESEDGSIGPELGHADETSVGERHRHVAVLLHQPGDRTATFLQTLFSGHAGTFEITAEHEVQVAVASNPERLRVAQILFNFLCKLRLRHHCVERWLGIRALFRPNAMTPTNILDWLVDNLCVLQRSKFVEEQQAATLSEVKSAAANSDTKIARLESTIAEQQKQIASLTESLKQQAAEVRRVSARLEKE
jgi:hypothetical protein